MSAEALQLQAEIVAPPTTGEILSAWSERIDRLKQEVGSGDVQQEFPEWWYENTAEVQNVKRLLKQEDADPADISRYYNLYTEEAAVYTKITGRERNGLIGRAIDDLGPGVIAKGFLSEQEDGPIHVALAESLSVIASESFGIATPELEALQNAYGLENITQVLGIRGGEYESKIHELVLDPRIIRWMRYKDQTRKDDDTWAETQAASRVWMSGALEAATGITHEEAMNYAFSASRRGEDESLGDIIGKFDHFGVERIRRITEATGIVGLEAYTKKQLERMDRFVTDPERFAATLKNHDVSVMLTNRVGDHNGVLSNAAGEFDDADRERMLFFEIASAADIFKTMAKLNKYGIKPSTLVLSAHSAPGRFIVTDERMKNLPRQDLLSIMGRKMVALANAAPDLDKGIKGYSMHGMKGVARAIEDYMAPSRGIDDNSGDIGRKKIIFQACHAGAEVEYQEIGDNGEKVPAGAESVISQLGKDLVATGVVSNVDIYGAPAGIQMHRTYSGVRYSGKPVDFDKGRTPLSAIRVSIDGGKISKGTVDEIPLRQLKP